MSETGTEHGTGDSRETGTAGRTDPDVAGLHDLCRELGEAADAVRRASRYTGGLALGTRLAVRALGSRRVRAARRRLLRALTDPGGLG
ncbi:hypothetical protein ITI46_29285, partial [Streptomyces oryzae]|nr:hypothetical protein [Streptomyces oryzae]